MRTYLLPIAHLDLLVKRSICNSCQRPTPSELYCSQQCNGPSRESWRNRKPTTPVFNVQLGGRTTKEEISTLLLYRSLQHTTDPKQNVAVRPLLSRKWECGANSPACQHVQGAARRSLLGPMRYVALKAIQALTVTRSIGKKRRRRCWAYVERGLTESDDNGKAHVKSRGSLAA